MAHRIVSDEVFLATALDLFRTYGFEGVSLKQLADATGLEKASLYYRYPGGKESIAMAAASEAVKMAPGKRDRPTGWKRASTQARVFCRGKTPGVLCRRAKSVRDGRSFDPWRLGRAATQSQGGHAGASECFRSDCKGGRIWFSGRAV